LLDFMVDVSARSSSEVGEALHEVEGESVSGRLRAYAVIRAVMNMFGDNRSSEKSV
jgi:hypothetical protein